MRHLKNLAMHANRTLKRTVSFYRVFFSISEIESTPMLQWMMGVSLLFFYATFNNWIYLSATTIENAARGDAICWPYFQECARLYFLHGLPFGYSQMILYMGLFSIMALIVFSMWRKWWTGAHALLTILFLWKTYVVFMLAYDISGNYDYYHLFLTFLLLFVPYKEYFLKLCFVVLYFLSVTTKFHQTWILGSYFTTLTIGAPIFPNAIIPIITNSVIFMQIIGAWYLLSKNPLWQRLALTYFILFHLYSGILVHYLYPTIALTALIVLFGPLYRYTPPPTNWKKALPGALFILSQFCFQLPAHFIVGDQKLTLEGNKYGMYMFEANHQCIADTRIYTYSNGEPVKESVRKLPPGVPCDGRSCITETHIYSDGAYNVREEVWQSAVAWNRCDPYAYWSRIKQEYCSSPSLAFVSMQYDHSIDGGPFYRLIDEHDICNLTYQPFTHNEWIQLPPHARIVGYPLQNVLR